MSYCEFARANSLAPTLLCIIHQMREEHQSTGITQDRLWYVVYSKPRREEFAQMHLCSKGLEVFFPRLAIPHGQSGQHQLIPLFPNYLFVRLQLPEEYSYALWSPGVKTIVSFNGVPAPIGEEIIAFLRKKSVQEGIIMGHSSLTVGQEVRIAGGPLDGLLGIIQHPPDARGRVGVLMQLLSRQVKVEVPIRFVTTPWMMQNKFPEDSLVSTTS